MSEFGFTITDLMAVLEHVAVIGYETNPGVASLPFEQLVDRLVVRLEWSRTQIEGAVTLLSLSPRANFLDLPAGMARSDVYPWRFNRSLSYLRRPLIQRPANGHIDVLWGNRHIESARTNLVALCLTGRLKAKSEPMRSFLGKMRHREGERFNDLVADIFQDTLGFPTKRRVRKVGSLRLGDHLGDIDVLAAKIQQGRLLVVECKDLSVARTSNELANEIKELFLGAEGERPTIQKHVERARWVRDHIPDVLQFLGIDRRGKWVVEPLIVVDTALMSPFMHDAGMRIVTVEQLKKQGV